MIVSQESNDDLQRSLQTTKTQQQRCFTSIQQRKFWFPFRSSVRLCPSMDLIAFEMIQQPQNQASSSSPSLAIAPSSSSSSMLYIHRTLNWQTIASVTSSSESNDENDNGLANTITTTKATNTDKLLYQTKTQLKTLEWRPDGRVVAVSVGRTIHIYSVEGLLNAETAPTIDGDEILNSGNNKSVLHDANDLEDNDMGKVYSFTLPDYDVKDQIHSANDIISLSWVHIGSWCEHTMWPRNTYNYDTYLHQQYYHKQYSDRWTYVLPPSAYHYENNSISDYHDTVSNTTNMSHALTGSLPNTSTSLSILCVSSLSGHLSLYLHGRYNIASNIPLFQTPSTIPFRTLPIIGSPDLTHFITATNEVDVGVHSPMENNNPLLSLSEPEGFATITILSFPALSMYRQNFQTISTIYCKVMQHIDTIRKSLPEIYATWKATLKPIDLKLDGLQKLFLNYGLVASDNSDGISNQGIPNKTNTIRSLLVQYILSGHTKNAPTLSNAVDQFFTSVQMNDQLLQRMGQALSLAVANVESTVRKLLVAPSTALVFEIDQLYGLSAYRSDLLSTDMTFQLLHHSQQLLIIVNTALTSLIEARSRLRNFIAWLRSTGANIKARGTATNSVQRENAKKRRIQESIIRKLLIYLQEEHYNGQGQASHIYVGLTEAMLNLRLAERFNETETSETKENQCPTSDLTSTLCIPRVLMEVTKLSNQVFDSPRAFVCQSMKRTKIRLPYRNSPHDKKYHRCMAMTTRLGQGDIDLCTIPFGDPLPSGYFSPNVSEKSHVSTGVTSVRQWLLVAQQIDSNCIQLQAFPLSWINSSDDEFDDDDEIDVSDGLYAESEWTVYLCTPPEHTIRDIVFYGDDGKSTLATTCEAAGTSIGGQEGRQRLGLLVSSRNSPSTKDESVELWLFPYDELEFLCQSIEQIESSSDDPDFTVYRCQDSVLQDLNRSEITPGPSCYNVVPTTTILSDGSNDDYDKSTTIVHARTRKVFDAVDFSNGVEGHPGSQQCRIVLSGSRGIGAVTLTRNGTTSLEILDVEEDEEDEEEEEENGKQDESMCDD